MSDLAHNLAVLALAFFGTVGVCVATQLAWTASSSPTRKFIRRAVDRATTSRQARHESIPPEVVTGPSFWLDDSAIDWKGFPR